MKVFKDEIGREWTLSLTIGSARKVRDLLQVNLLELDKGEPPLITRLGTDLILIVDILYVLVKDQADRLTITDEQFGCSLNGDAFMRAQGAFYDELVLFFRGLGRADLALALEKQRGILVQAVEVMETKIDEIDTFKIVKDAFGKSSTNLPEQSDVIPAHSPSES